jgi:hypothetical protein
MSQPTPLGKIIPGLMREIENNRRNTMSEFKVGDRVRYVGVLQPGLARKVGKVIDGHGSAIDCNFDGNPFLWACSPDSLELIKEEKMSDTLTVDKSRVIEAANKCPQAKDALKTIFPDAFKEGWVVVTKEIEVEADSSFGSLVVNVKHGGKIIGNINAKVGLSIYPDNYRQTCTGNGQFWIIEKRV